jgi:hypothetical protein
VRDEEAVAADPDRQRHIVFFADREPGHDEIEHVLLILGMEDDHAAVQEIGHLNIVRLDGQRRIHDTAGKHGHGRQPMTRP